MKDQQLVQSISNKTIKVIQGGRVPVTSFLKIYLGCQIDISKFSRVDFYYFRNTGSNKRRIGNSVSGGSRFCYRFTVDGTLINKLDTPGGVCNILLLDVAKGLVPGYSRDDGGRYIDYCKADSTQNSLTAKLYPSRCDKFMLRCWTSETQFEDHLFSKAPNHSLEYNKYVEY